MAEPSAAAAQGSPDDYRWEWPSSLERLVRDLAGSYNFRVDSPYPGSALRYIAVARRLDISPYAVVTADPAELRAALRSPEQISGRSHRPARDSDEDKKR
jgi:hypothetical protein